MVKKCFVLQEEVIGVFHKKNYSPTIEKLLFHLARVRILGSMECRKNRNDFFVIMYIKYIKSKKYYPQENTVVYAFKEIIYLFHFVDIGTAVS